MPTHMDARVAPCQWTTAGASRAPRQCTRRVPPRTREGTTSIARLFLAPRWVNAG